MSEWIETELKLGLPDRRAWQWVRDRLGPGDTREQVNHFFDRPDRGLAGQRLGVRIRIEAERATLTVKGDLTGLPTAPDREADEITRRIELEASIDRDVVETALTSGLELTPWIVAWRAPQGATCEQPDDAARTAFLAQLESVVGGERLRRIGGFRNRREVFPVRLEDEEGPIELELELDRTQFPNGHVDYEIEVEKTSERGGAMIRTHRALSDWLDREGSIRTHPVQSKLARLQSHLSE